MTDERAIDLSVEVPGTPEEVWADIATGPGITSWFVPHTVEGREGGAVSMDFGYGPSAGRVTAWEPPHRLVLEGDDLAHEWLVEARSGGGCVVRLVVSGFGEGDDWDAQYDGMTSGWRLFLENLRLHRTHFPGRAAASVIPTQMVPGGLEAAFARFCGALGLPADQEEGAAFRTTGSGVPALAGTVDRVLRLPGATAYLLVLDEPAPGHGILAAEGTGDTIAVSLWLYAYGDRAAELLEPFPRFLADRFGTEDGQSA